MNPKNLLADPRLMEVEIKYIRDVGIEVKALLDKDTNGEFEITYERLEDGVSVFKKTFKVPDCSQFGSGPAGELFDSIKLG